MMHDESGVAAVHAVLEEHDAGNLRVVTRSEEDEPAVVAEIPVCLAGRGLALVGDDLSGPRLAAHIVTGNSRIAAGASRAVDGHPHAVFDDLKVLRIDRRLGLRWRRRHRLPPAAVVYRLQQMWCHTGPAVGQRRHVDGHRDRGRRDLTLTDADRNRLARVPLLVHPLTFPLRGGHQALHLIRQIVPAQDAHPKGRRPLVDLVDADHVRDRVEVHVTRLLDGVAQVDRTVAAPAEAPALEITTVEVGVTRAVHVEVGRDDAFLETSERYRHLERRSRRVAALDRAIVERTIAIGIERGPRLTVDPRSEGVRIVRGMAGEAEHAAGVGVEHDRRAVQADRVEPVLDRLLHVEIDRQLKPLPFGRRILFERSDLAADAVDHNAPRAVFAHEVRVVDLLQARLASDVAALQLAVLAYLFVAHFADVAEQVGRRRRRISSSRTSWSSGRALTAATCASV